jgi:hypothetical protein
MGQAHPYFLTIYLGYAVRGGPLEQSQLIDEDVPFKGIADKLAKKGQKGGKT